jgi:hypothetical protein
VRGSFPFFEVISPNGVVYVLIDRFGVPGCALFRTLKTSSQNWRVFASVILNDLLRFESNATPGRREERSDPGCPVCQDAGSQERTYPEAASS